MASLLTVHSASRTLSSSQCRGITETRKSNYCNQNASFSASSLQRLQNRKIFCPSTRRLSKTMKQILLVKTTKLIFLHDSYRSRPTRQIKLAHRYHHLTTISSLSLPSKARLWAPVHLQRQLSLISTLNMPISSTISKKAKPVALSRPCEPSSALIKEWRALLLWRRTAAVIICPILDKDPLP